MARNRTSHSRKSAPATKRSVRKAKTVKPGRAKSAAVRKTVTRAKQRGYVTYDELNKVLPSDKVSSEQIEDTMAMLNEMGINVIESEEQDEQGELPALVQAKQVVVKTGEEEEPYDRTDDPVRMYLREMGSVELLSREGEIAIAKR